MLDLRRRGCNRHLGAQRRISEARTAIVSPRIEIRERFEGSWCPHELRIVDQVERMQRFAEPMSGVDLHRNIGAHALIEPAIGNRLFHLVEGKLDQVVKAGGCRPLVFGVVYVGREDKERAATRFEPLQRLHRHRIVQAIRFERARRHRDRHRSGKSVEGRVGHDKIERACLYALHFGQKLAVMNGRTGIAQRPRRANEPAVVNFKACDLSALGSKGGCQRAVSNRGLKNRLAPRITKDLGRGQPERIGR